MVARGAASLKYDDNRVARLTGERREMEPLGRRLEVIDGEKEEKLGLLLPVRCPRDDGKVRMNLGSTTSHGHDHGHGCDSSPA